MSTSPFIGEINILPYTFTPRDYVSCNGQVLPITQNSALYSVIGLAFGGNGQTTVGIPNLEGRAPMHSGRGPGLTPQQIGDYGGLATVVLAQDQLPQHDHNWTVIREPKPDDTQSADATLGVAIAGNEATYMFSTKEQPTDAMSEQAISYFGANLGHENRQPWLALQFCMAIDGVYPSRG